MVVAMQPLLVGAIWLTSIVVAPSLLLWVVLRIPKVVEAIRDRRAARRADDPTQPLGLPLEKLAADLRRLRAELVHRKPSNNLRLTALVEAYDDVLDAISERLEITSQLRELPLGRDRDVERLRTEAAVEQAGVPLEVPGHRYGRPNPER
jgi:hypothetical protein